MHDAYSKKRTTSSCEYFNYVFNLQNKYTQIKLNPCLKPKI